jgi:hypothetical protein
MIDGYRIAKIAAGLGTFTVIGLGRRNVWLATSGTIAIVSMIASWDYGYRLSPNVDLALQVCAIIFASFAFILWIRMMNREQRNKAS